MRKFSLGFKMLPKYVGVLKLSVVSSMFVQLGVNAVLQHDPCTQLNKHSANTVKLHLSLRKKATIHQLTIMLSTSKNVLFPGHNHLLTTSDDDLTLISGG